MHCTCAALHARETARELWRALYAGACADRWPRRWWVGVIAAALVLACGAMLSGCQWIGRKPAPGPVAPTGPATTAATLATAAVAAGEARSLAAGAAAGRDARLAADVLAAGNALDSVPPRVPDARAAVAVAAGHLSGVAPDPQEAQALASAERSRQAGDSAGADAAILALATQARTDAADLATLRQRAAQAEAARDAAQAALIRAGEQGAQRLAQALDKERRGVLAGQVAKLSWIGIACCAGAAIALGAGIAIGGVAALRRVGPAAVVLGIVGLGCLGAAQIIGARWFLPVVGACGGGAVLWFAVWAYRHQRRGDLAQELATRSGKVAAVAKTAVPVLDAAYEEADAGEAEGTKQCERGGGAVLWFAVWAYRHQKRGDLAQELAVRSGKVAAVAKTAVPVLDKAYEEADDSVRAWLDAHVFNRLSDLMRSTPEMKATVHAIRAEAKQADGVVGA